ncbi:MAG: hypothetical protein ABI885_23715, partial [Gammaproteobacteria bacterium]
AMQVMARIRSSLAIDVPVRFMFQFPTLRRLSVQVDEMREARLIESIAGGGDDIDTLLERVRSMPEGKVEELVRQMTMGGRL